MSVIPSHIREVIEAVDEGEKLIEIIMDLGRCPEARFTDHEMILSEKEITQNDLDYVVERIGKFMGDNRAGIERTLHRISAILNRQGRVIGLTCRVGRAVFGTVDIVRDILESGQSLVWAKRRCCVKPPGFWPRRSGSSLLTPQMRSPETATYRILPLAAPEECRWPNPNCSTK